MMDDEHLFNLKRNFISIKHLDHPDIIKYKAFYYNIKKHISYLIMEYWPFQNLL
jgi:hypothetical protein